MQKMTNNKENLLELCFSPDLGGLELYMLRCAQALVSDFNVVSVIHPQGKLKSYYEGSSDKYVEIEKRSNLLMLGAAKRLAEVIDAHEVSIVHLHWTKDIPIAVLAKKLSKQDPKLVQTRNMLMTRFKDDFYHRFLYKNIALMVPTSYEVKDQIERFIPSDIRPKVEVVYMGVAAPEMLSEQDVETLRNDLGMKKSFSVGLVGRIEESKGQILLIKAIKYLGDQGLDVQAFFVGHPMQESYLETLKTEVKGLGLESRIHFLGFMKNPHHFMQVCDALVLATKHETFGLVLIEAMQMGTAIIGANRGGPVEIIEDEKSGLLFESMSSESLAEKIAYLYKDNLRKEAIAKAGKERAQEMFLDTVQFQKLSAVIKDNIVVAHHTR